MTDHFDPEIHPRATFGTMYMHTCNHVCMSKVRIQRAYLESRARRVLGSPEGSGGDSALVYIIRGCINIYGYVFHPFPAEVISGPPTFALVGSRIALHSRRSAAELSVPRVFCRPIGRRARHAQPAAQVLPPLRRPAPPTTAPLAQLSDAFSPTAHDPLRTLAPSRSRRHSEASPERRARSSRRALSGETVAATSQSRIDRSAASTLAHSSRAQLFSRLQILTHIHLFISLFLPTFVSSLRCQKKIVFL